MFVLRDRNRTESDDFKLNVQPVLTVLTEAIPVYCLHSDSRVTGWLIRSRYE